VEAATNLRLSKIQADWGGEFRNQELETELQQRGMALKPTIPRHSETNAIIERANRTILKMSQTALISAKLPKGLWDKASDAMAYTKNRVPHKTLQGKTPIEVFLQKDPVKERANLRPFSQQVICYDQINFRPEAMKHGLLDIHKHSEPIRPRKTIKATSSPNHPLR